MLWERDNLRGRFLLRIDISNQETPKSFSKYLTIVSLTLISIGKTHLIFIMHRNHLVQDCFVETHLESVQWL
jgi:hypothetical protein